MIDPNTEGVNTLSKKALIISEARSWLGTPWHHNQSCKGAGVDCVQLLAACATAAGIPHQDLGNYYRSPNGDSLVESLSEVLGHPVGFERAILEAGSVVCFRFSGIPHHVAIVTAPNRIIHASFSHRSVVEHNLDYFLHRRGVCGFLLV